MPRVKVTPAAAPEPKPAPRPVPRPVERPADPPSSSGGTKKLAPKPDKLVIPHDLVNEQVLIVAASDKDTRAKLVRATRPEMFLGDKHAEIWRGFVELDRQNLEYSSAALHQVTGGKADGAYVDKLLASYKTIPPNLSHHLDALAWDKARVESVNGPIASLLKLLQDPTTPPDAVRAAGRSVMLAYDAAGGDLRYLRNPSELVRTQIAEVRGRKLGRARFNYGIDGLDVDHTTGRPILTPGAAPGQLSLVTGVPGSGKSVFSLRVALGQIEMGNRVLYGAWEIKSETALELLAAFRLGLSRTALLEGKLTAREEELLEEQMEIVAGYVKFMDLPFGRSHGQKKRITNEENLDIVHRYTADAGCDVAIFDLFKRCLRETDPDDEEQALYRVQAIMLETNVHGVLVHQQRAKDLEARADKRPTREGIKGSSAWFEVVDTMFGIHRPGLWKRLDHEVLEVDILKQRYGEWPLAVEFDWAGEFGSIENGRKIQYDPPGGDTGQGDVFADMEDPKDKLKGRRGPRLVR
jgi:KaiC/GvpD/RAD55 family RecA-like ATPase